MHERKLENRERFLTPFERVYELRDYYYLLLRSTKGSGIHFSPSILRQQPPPPPALFWYRRFLATVLAL